MGLTLPVGRIFATASCENFWLSSFTKDVWTRHCGWKLRRWLLAFSEAIACWHSVQIRTLYWTFTMYGVRTKRGSCTTQYSSGWSWTSYLFLIGDGTDVNIVVDSASGNMEGSGSSVQRWTAASSVTGGTFRSRLCPLDLDGMFIAWSPPSRGRPIAEVMLEGYSRACAVELEASDDVSALDCSSGIISSASQCWSCSSNNEVAEGILPTGDGACEESTKFSMHLLAWC